MTKEQQETALNPHDSVIPVYYGRMNLRTMITIRWIAIAGQALTITFITSLGFIFPSAACMALVLLSALVNLAFMSARRIRMGQPNVWLGDYTALALLSFDLLQLALLLWLTGGLSNPFSILLLAPVSVSAITMRRRYTLMVTIFALLITAALWRWHLPLPYQGAPIALPPLLNDGIAAALAVAMAFLSFYLANVSYQRREMAEALSDLRLALERERRISALGGLAAAAAHELGTPLSTIAIIAKEMIGDLSNNSELYKDAQLLLEESNRCRDILAELSANHLTDNSASYNLLPVQTLVELALERHKDAYTPSSSIHAEAIGNEVLPQPRMSRRPEIIQGLGNLLQNALQHAKSNVNVTCHWNTTSVIIIIRDDGLGFELDILHRLGEPYVRGDRKRKQGSKHSTSSMGIGVFIASTLLENSGAKVQFSNHQEGGACVTITWERSNLP